MSSLTSHHFDVFVVPGGSALPAFRAASLLERIQAVAPQVTGVTANHVHLVASDEALADDDAETVAQILDYGPAAENPATDQGEPTASLVVAPRLGTISPWASKATDIVRNCGIDLHRVERVTEYAFGKLRWEHLWLTNAQDNHGSRRIKEKQGARLVDLMLADYVGGRGSQMVWLLMQKDWALRQAA